MDKEQFLIILIKIGISIFFLSVFRMIANDQSKSCWYRHDLEKFTCLEFNTHEYMKAVYETALETKKAKEVLELRRKKLESRYEKLLSIIASQGEESLRLYRQIESKRLNDNE
jgi:hypothetical protein